MLKTINWNNVPAEVKAAETLMGGATDGSLTDRLAGMYRIMTDLQASIHGLDAASERGRHKKTLETMRKRLKAAQMCYEWYSGQYSDTLANKSAMVFTGTRAGMYLETIGAANPYHPDNWLPSDLAIYVDFAFDRDFQLVLSSEQIAFLSGLMQAGPRYVCFIHLNRSDCKPTSIIPGNSYDQLPASSSSLIMNAWSKTIILADNQVMALLQLYRRHYIAVTTVKES